MNINEYNNKRKLDQFFEIVSKRIVELKNAKPLNPKYNILHENTIEINLKLYKILKGKLGVE